MSGPLNKSGYSYSQAVYDVAFANKVGMKIHLEKESKQKTVKFLVVSVLVAAFALGIGLGRWSKSFI